MTDLNKQNHKKDSSHTLEEKEKKPEVNEETENLKREKEEWKGKYLRALADYQNLVKRSYLEKQEIVKFASVNMIVRILDVLDVFELAQKHSKDQNFVIGITSLKNLLKEEGVKELEVVGKKFDPMIMECVETPKEGEETVSEEIRKGYMMHDKVIRVARVKIGNS